METQRILEKKAKEAQVIYDYLCDLFHIESKLPVTFIANELTNIELKKNYLKENPFPNVIALVLAKLRKKAVTKLFEDEKILQTPTYDSKFLG